MYYRKTFIFTHHNYFGHTHTVGSLYYIHTNRLDHTERGEFVDYSVGTLQWHKLNEQHRQNLQ